MEINKPFLGRGWSFPPAFDNENNAVQMSEAEKDIQESLMLILSTAPGERVMRPDFGCNLNDLAFESLNVTLQTYITDKITSAIIRYEARIDLNAVDIIPDDKNDSLLFIHLDYTVRSSNSRFNQVYPFYINEGVRLI